MGYARALLEVRGLVKRFGGLTALAGVDLEVGEGEILGVIGPNGAGKSTLFGVIAGALPASEGEVRFGGEPILGLPPHAIAARGLMRTFQHNRPFPGMSLLENVLVGAHTRFESGLWKILGGGSAAEERRLEAQARSLVEFVGLAEFDHAAVDTLSFGQGRLLEIARGLAGEPKLMLFDEPAAGLTPAECDRVSAIIRGIASRGIAVLLIEHDMRFLMPLAHRVAVLNFGAKIAEGTPAQVRSHPAVMEAYLGDAAAL